MAALNGLASYFLTESLIKLLKIGKAVLEPVSYFPKVFGLSPKIDFIVYNLLDRYNEYGVSSETGRAYTSVVNETELLSHRSNFNTYDDRYKDPSMFQAPRQIKVGLTIPF